MQNLLSTQYRIALENYVKLQEIALLPLHCIDECIDECIHQGCPTPIHVESHPEKRKPGNKQDWDHNDWGNFIADRAAAADYESLHDIGIQTRVLEVAVSEIYKDLLSPLQWYIGYTDGTPVIPSGPLAHIQKERFDAYIKDRDADRATRSDPAFWSDNSLTYSSRVFNMQRTSVSNIASKCRLIYEKHWHGRNRQKDDTLSESERIEVGKCLLCQAPDSQEHTFHHCTNKTLTALRDEIRINLTKHIHQYDSASALHRKIGRAVLLTLDITNVPGRLWTGNLSSQQIHHITSLLNPDAISTLT